MHSTNDKQLTGHQRLKQGFMAIGCLIASMVTMLYGLIFATNFITQLNPLNTWVVYLAALISYGLVALVFVLLLLHANKSMTQAFSGVKD